VDLVVDQPVDRPGQGTNQLLQTRAVGDDTGEDVGDDLLDVDLLLDRVGDLRRDGVRASACVSRTPSRIGRSSNSTPPPVCPVLNAHRADAATPSVIELNVSAAGFPRPVVATPAERGSGPR
jgi:hypothetical protein